MLWLSTISDRNAFMKNLRKILPILLAGSMMYPMASHANSVQGPDQMVDIITTPSEAGSSHCEIINKSGHQIVYRTPTKLDIMKAVGLTDIQCESSDGMWVGHIQLKAKFDGSFEGIVNLPFTGLFAMNNVLNDFSDPIGGDTGIGNAVKYPDRIIIPMHSRVERIGDAQPVDQAQAIANAPEPAAVPERHVSHHVKKVVKAHHTEESHS